MNDNEFNRASPSVHASTPNIHSNAPHSYSNSDREHTMNENEEIAVRQLKVNVHSSSKNKIKKLKHKSTPFPMHKPQKIPVSKPLLVPLNDLDNVSSLMLDDEDDREENDESTEDSDSSFDNYTFPYNASSKKSTQSTPQPIKRQKKRAHTQSKYEDVHATRSRISRSRVMANNGNQNINKMNPVQTVESSLFDHEDGLLTFLIFRFCAVYNLKTILCTEYDPPNSHGHHSSFPKSLVLASSLSEPMRNKNLKNLNKFGFGAAIKSSQSAQHTPMNTLTQTLHYDEGQIVCAVVDEINDDDESCLTFDSKLNCNVNIKNIIYHSDNELDASNGYSTRQRVRNRSRILDINEQTSSSLDTPKPRKKSRSKSKSSKRRKTPTPSPSPSVNVGMKQEHHSVIHSKHESYTKRASMDSEGSLIRIMKPKKKKKKKRSVKIIRRRLSKEEKRRLKQLKNAQSFQPSLRILSEYSTLSENVNEKKRQHKDTIDYILNAPPSENTNDNESELSDSADIEYQEYIGSEYGTSKGKEDATTTYSHSNQASTTFYANEFENVELSLIKEAELSEFVGDERWQTAIQNAYLKGFNKGYFLGAQFGFKQASK